MREDLKVKEIQGIGGWRGLEGYNDGRIEGFGGSAIQRGKEGWDVGGDQSVEVEAVRGIMGCEDNRGGMIEGVVGGMILGMRRRSRGKEG